MSVEWTLLILRVVSGLALLGFLGAVFAVLWRDYRATAEAAAGGARGRLLVIGVGELSADALPLTDETATLEGVADRAAAALSGPGGLLGASFPLLPLTSLGRAPTNTVVLNDTFCSQDHALIVRRGGQWWLEDRRSSNGTRLNGERIREPVVISSGDVIGIGRVRLKVELG